MGVMVILLGGIFLIVQTALKTVIVISDYASREDEMTNLVDILRNGFRNLPPRAKFAAQGATIDGQKGYLLTFRNAPGFLTWHGQEESDRVIVLLAAKHDDENGLWRLCLKRFVPPETMSEREMSPAAVLRASAGVRWLELVGDFRRVAFRFRADSKSAWANDWLDQTRPALVEVNLGYEHAKDPGSERTIIWVPPILPEVAAQ